MKTYIFLLVVIIVTACNSSKNEQNVQNESVQNNVTQVKKCNYSYIQSNDSVESKKILIVVIDPHSDGKGALTYFSEIVGNYNCTIIGLNNVENNQPDFMQRISDNISSAIEDLNLNVEQLYLAGFSGGASMTFMYAENVNVNGVLMCGMGFEYNKLYNLKFPVASIIGTRDFNFISQYYSPGSEISKNTNFLNIIFEGKHQWPDEVMILNAFSYLFSKNIENSDFDFSFFKNLSSDYLKNDKKYLAYKMLEAYCKSTGNYNEMNSMLNEQNFKTYIQNFENILSSENQRNSEYVNYISQKDTLWWKKEIKDLDEKTNSSNILLSDSYARTKAFLGIVLYSYVSKEIQNPQSSFIDNLIKIYEYCEPENPDVYFYKSVRYMQLNNSEKSWKSLQKSFELGFKDTLKAVEFGLM